MFRHLTHVDLNPNKVCHTKKHLRRFFCFSSFTFNYKPIIHVHYEDRLSASVAMASWKEGKLEAPSATIQSSFGLHNPNNPIRQRQAFPHLSKFSSTI